MTYLDSLARAKFYFHLISDCNIVRDNIGVHLSTHDGVFTAVSAAIEHLMTEDWLSLGDWYAVQIEVFDCHGHPLTSFVIRRPDCKRGSMSLH